MDGAGAGGADRGSPAVGAGAPPGVRVLLVTRRADLVEEVGALARAAGVAVAVVAEPPLAGRAWAEAHRVLLGEDAAALGVPARRGGLVLVTSGDRGAAPWRLAVRVGARDVVVLPEDAPLLLDDLTLLADVEEGPPAGCVAVVSARGGAGASTLAAALALRSGELRPTLLVDGDPLGGGLDLLVGAEEAPGLRWPDLVGARGAVRSALLREALPAAGDPSRSRTGGGGGARVLGWDRDDAVPWPGGPPGGAVDAVLAAARRGHDLLVLDLPRSADPAVLTALRRADVLLLLVPAEVRAVAAARRLVGVLAPHVGDVRLVVRTGARPALPPHAVADALELPVAARLGHEAGAADGPERGELPGARRRGALARCAADLDPAVAAAIAAARAAPDAPLPGGAGGGGW